MRARVHLARPPFWAIVAACVAAALVSLLLPSSPAYDAWAWLVWGREIAELDLETQHGPSWKPLPIFFTTVFAFAGDAAPELWIVVGRAGALVALVVAYRVAARLTGGRLAPVAGVIAVVALLLTEGWIRNGAVAYSEGLLVALALGAVDRHLAGARTQAFVLAFGAALVRPEVWPFLGAYAVYLWLREPPRRPLVAALLALVPVLWFGPDFIATGDPLRSSTRAQHANPGMPVGAPDPAAAVIRVFRDQVIDPVAAGAVFAAAAAALAYAGRRRGGAVLALAAATVAIVGIVAAMTEGGYSGNLRYLLLPASLVCVLAGVGWARALRLAAGLARERFRTPAAGVATGVGLAVLILAAAFPSADARVREIAVGLDRYAYVGRLYQDLGPATEEARAAGAVACGQAFTGRYDVPAVAWYLHVHIGQVGFEARAPAVVFRARTARSPLAEPILPRSGPRFRTVAVVGDWEVLAACQRPLGVSGGGRP